MKVSYTGLDEFSSYIRKLTDYVSNPAKTFALSRIIMFQDVMKHFQDEMAPEGRWKPLKLKGLSYYKFKKRTGLEKRENPKTKTKILQDTGRLKNSITTVSGNTYAEIGTNIVYGATHQFGRGAIPARKFLWLSDDACERILDQFMTDMKGV